MSRVFLTPRARDRIRSAFAAGEPSVLTVSYAGGCGAPGFVVRLTRAGIPGVEPFEADGTMVALDSIAEARLSGATVDWSEEEEFALLHPAAVEPTPC
jgi:Fe-S cluster assembly iron-binding protein IscA